MTGEFRDVEVAVSGGVLTVRARPGVGPTLLLLHYWGGSGRTWDPTVTHLDPRVPVAYYDHRGWGRSNALPGPFGLAQLAADARAVMDALDTDVVLVGHSMGGKVAVLVAAERPSALSSLVLVAPAPPEPPPVVTAQFREQLAHAYDNAETVAHAVDHVLTAGPLEAGVREAVIADSLSGAAAARTEWPLHGIAEDITAAARRIAVDTTVIAATGDVVEPVYVLRKHLLPFIPRARFEVFAGPGHLIPLEAPERLAEVLAASLRNGDGVPDVGPEGAETTYGGVA